MLYFFAISTPSFKYFAIYLNSFSLHPLVVIEGVPNLRPFGFNALLSPFTVFLFRDIFTFYNKNSVAPPSIPILLKSTNNIWFLVPPVITLKPSSYNAFPKAYALATVYY